MGHSDSNLHSKIFLGKEKIGTHLWVRTRDAPIGFLFGRYRFLLADLKVILTFNLHDKFYMVVLLRGCFLSFFFFFFAIPHIPLNLSPGYR